MQMYATHSLNKEILFSHLNRKTFWTVYQNRGCKWPKPCNDLQRHVCFNWLSYFPACFVLFLFSFGVFVSVCAMFSDSFFIALFGDCYLLILLACPISLPFPKQQYTPVNNTTQWQWFAPCSLVLWHEFTHCESYQSRLQPSNTENIPRALFFS